MRNILKGFIIIILFSVLSMGALANFEVSSETIKNAITMDEMAAFNITIGNNYDRTETFRIFHLNYPDWSIESKPKKNPIILTVPPGEKKSITVYIRPLKIKSFGTYFVDLKIKNTRSDITRKI